MKKVLVTGATGFIGQASLNALRQRDFEIHAISTHPVPLVAIKTKEIIWHQLDIHDYSSVKELLAKISPDSLLHLAWYIEHGLYWSSNENLKWVASSLNLVQEFINNGGSRLVCSGTCAEYDWGPEYCSQAILEEKTPINPATLYGACKASLYETLSVLTKIHGISFAWGRLFFPYGFNENPKRLIPSAVHSLLQNKTITCNNPELRRDFIFINDVAEIFAELISKETSGPINIASGQAVSLGEVVKQIASMLNVPDLVNYKVNSKNMIEPLLLVANVDRLKDDLECLAQTTLTKGLEKTIAWWEERIN